MDFQEMESILLQMSSDIAELKTALIVEDSATVTREDILEELGRSRSWLFARPWVLPNFGKPDIPGKPSRWYRENWDEWKKDIDGHERFWRANKLWEKKAV